MHSDTQKYSRFDRVDAAVVFIDPQNDVLSEKGTAWEAVGQSVTANKTVENMERLFRAAKQNGFEVFISPHYFYPRIVRGSSTTLWSRASLPTRRSRVAGR